MNLANGAVLIVAPGGSPADQAERAARAALAAARGQAEARVAVVTGRGRVAGRLPVGEVVTRAVELLHARADGRVRVDEATANLLAARFVIEAEGPTQILQRERAAHGARKDRAIPIVGRDAEIALLDATLGECIDEPRAHAVVITGPPGIGKSRLKDELFHRAGSRAPRIWQGRGDPIGAGSSLGLLAQIVRSGLDLAGAPPGAIRDRITARLRARLPEADAGRSAEFLAEMLHSATDDASVQLQVARRNPLLMGDRMRQAFEDLIAAECAAEPLVIVLEDLHWGDLPSVSFLDSALRRAAELPLLVIAIGRPEVDEAFPDLFRDHDPKRVRLGPLSARPSQKLARALLGEGATDATIATVVERGQGIPFLIEELARAITEGRGDRLPESVLAIAQARLESLDGAARRVLRAASVFGRRFWRGGVSLMLGGDRRTGSVEWIQILLAKDVIVKRSPSRFAGEEEYAFRQPLLGEAAYAALTEQDRALGHRLAGEWLERMGEDDELALAEHFARGAEPARAARHYARAALHSLEGHDFQAAIARARAGLAGADDGELHLALAEALRWTGSFAEADAHAVRAALLLDRAEAPAARRFRAREERTVIAVRLGRFDDAAAWAREALAPDVDRADADTVSAYVRYLCATARAAFQSGAYDLAEPLLVRVRELAALADPAARAEVHRLEGARARHNGDLAGDARAYALAQGAFHEAGDARNACNAQVSLGFAYFTLGQIERAAATLEEALAAAERLCLTAIATRARQNLGLVLGWRGDVTAARALLLRVASESRAQGNVRFEGWTRIYLSNVSHAAGDFEGAEAEATIAVTLLASTPPALAGALAARARALTALARIDEATIIAGCALEILRELGSIEEFEPLVRLAWIEALAAAGRAEESAAAAAEAKHRIELRAAAISDAGWRTTFFERVPENVAILAHAEARP